MSDQMHESKTAGANDWLHTLGLSPRATSARQRQLLRSLTPIGFTRQSEKSTELLSASDVASEIEMIRADEDAAAKADPELRRIRGLRNVQEALTAVDADEPVMSGSWVGFARGRALAWCWNLYQYEPHGFISPGSQLRMKNIALLKRGELPDGFGYAERARELELSGVDPEHYRTMQSLLGRRIYDRDNL